MLEFNYNGSDYIIEDIVGGLYTLRGKGFNIVFECEWKGGSYFKIKSVTKNGRTYQAQKYHYQYIPAVREATFKVFQTVGLYDYKNHKFIDWKEEMERRKLN